MARNSKNDKGSKRAIKPVYIIEGEVYFVKSANFHTGGNNNAYCTRFNSKNHEFGKLCPGYWFLLNGQTAFTCEIPAVLGVVVDYIADEEH